MTDNDSVEGATNVKGIWIDEAGKIRYNAWINLFARSSFSQCPIFITTTPYALNWLYKEIYLPWLQKTRDDIEIIQFRSCDNPYFPKEEYDNQKRILDPRVFEMRYGGTFQRMAGLVYPELDELNYIEDSKPAANFFEYYAGVDIGFSNPFAVTIRAIKKDGTQDIQVAEFYRSFLNPVERTNVLKQLHQVYNFKQCFIDSAHPDDIALFSSAGLPATGVVKGANSVAFGIQLHQEIIKTKVYRIIATKCPNTLDEYSTYHYQEKEDTLEKNIKEDPVQVKDHLMDANRYVTMMTVNLRNKAKAPFKPEKTHLQHLLHGDYKKKENDWYNN
jgi:PBSX family phage terminase large subunit